MLVYLLWARFDSNLDSVIFFCTHNWEIKKLRRKEEKNKIAKFVKIFILLIEVLVKITKLTTEKIRTI